MAITGVIDKVYHFLTMSFYITRYCKYSSVVVPVVISIQVLSTLRILALLQFYCTVLLLCCRFEFIVLYVPTKVQALYKSVFDLCVIV